MWGDMFLELPCVPEGLPIDLTPTPAYDEIVTARAAHVGLGLVPLSIGQAGAGGT